MPDSIGYNPELLSFVAYSNPYVGSFADFSPPAKPSSASPPNPTTPILAATALLRLAEVRREQDRTDEAIALYQRLVTDFPASEKLVLSAKEHLSALGAPLPSIPGPIPDEETRPLAKFRQWETASPNLLNDPNLLDDASGAIGATVLRQAFLLLH